MKNLNGKVIALTGAGSGIGRSLAIQLAQHGSHLSLSDVDEAGLKETKELLWRDSWPDSWLYFIKRRDSSYYF